MLVEVIRVSERPVTLIRSTVIETLDTEMGLTESENDAVMFGVWVVTSVPGSGSSGVITTGPFPAEALGTAEPASRRAKTTTPNSAAPERTDPPYSARAY